MYDHKSVIAAQFESLAAERAAAVAAYESARISEDNYAVMESADRILAADQKQMALDRIAQNYVASQSIPAGNAYNLNQDEQEVAKVSGISDETYAKNKQRYQAMKSQGYWDQGRVFK